MKSSCIGNKQNVSNNKNQSKSKKKRYLIQNTNNFQYYASLKMLVSQPIKYFILHAVIICGMIYFYVLSFVTGHIVLQINYAIVALHIIVFILLLILGFKNPGIILKISEDFDSQTKIHIPFDRDSKPAVNQMAKSFTFPLKSHFITLKFCPQCLIYKPPRTVHCWTCNACVQKMDHHCPFIGNCVGKGNYQIFFCFVTLLGCKLILIMGQLIILIVRLFQNNHEVAFEKPELYFAVILFLFTLIALIFVGSLGSFHLYLIVNNLTTNQLCKQTWDSVSGNPFKKFISGPTNQKLLDPTQNLQKSMVPRFKDKSEQFLSSYENSQPPLSVLKKSQLFANKSQQIIQKQEGATTQQQILNISGKSQI